MRELKGFSEHKTLASFKTLKPLLIMKGNKLFPSCEDIYVHNQRPGIIKTIKYRMKIFKEISCPTVTIARMQRMPN